MLLDVITLPYLNDNVALRYKMIALNCIEFLHLSQLQDNLFTVERIEIEWEWRVLNDLVPCREPKKLMGLFDQFPLSTMEALIWWYPICMTMQQ